MERPQAPTTAKYAIHRADVTSVPSIQSIEQSATRKFASMPALADLATGSPVPTSKIETWLNTGRIYLAQEATTQSEALGFVAVHPLDSTLYIAEISVCQAHNNRGVGGMLLEAVFAWAREEGKIVSLTTYREVPWNGPFYRKRGFREIEAEQLGVEHVAKMEEENDLVREGWERCCFVWGG